MRSVRSGRSPDRWRAHWNRYESTVIICVSCKRLVSRILRRSLKCAICVSGCNRLALATRTRKLSSIFSRMRFFNVSSLPAASSCKLCKRHSTCIYGKKCIAVMSAARRIGTLRLLRDAFAVEYAAIFDSNNYDGRLSAWCVIARFVHSDRGISFDQLSPINVTLFRS